VSFFTSAITPVFLYVATTLYTTLLGVSEVNVVVYVALVLKAVAVLDSHFPFVLKVSNSSLPAVSTEEKVALVSFAFNHIYDSVPLLNGTKESSVLAAFLPVLSGRIPTALKVNGSFK